MTLAIQYVVDSINVNVYVKVSFIHMFCSEVEDGRFKYDKNTTGQNIQLLEPEMVRESF